MKTIFHPKKILGELFVTIYNIYVPGICMYGNDGWRKLGNLELR
jgi:hypothetical protein